MTSLQAVTTQAVEPDQNLNALAYQVKSSGGLTTVHDSFRHGPATCSEV